MSLCLARVLPDTQRLISRAYGHTDVETVEEELRVGLDGDRDWVLGHYPGVEVRSVLVRGTTVDILAEHSIQSSLVVLGTKGRGGFTGWLVGSTTRGLIQRSTSHLLVGSAS